MPNHPDTAIIMRTKDRTVYELGAAGNVVWRSNGPEGSNYSGKWTIVGFKTRHNAHRTVSLEEALAGADIGQGWVVDLDHGTYRLWGSPIGNKCATLERTP